MKTLLSTCISWICILFFHITPLYGQQIQGKIIDSLSQKSLGSVPVQVLGKDTVLITGSDGTFTLVGESAHVLVQIPGYLTLQDSCFIQRPCTLFLIPDTILQLPTISIRARSIRRNQGTPAYQLDRSQLENTLSYGVQEALKAIPSVHMETGAWNTNRISMRGIGSRTPFSTSKLRVYLDDIPLTNGIGESTLEDLDPAIFQKIEVLPGPNPGAYGAALGGTILLHSLNKANWPRRTFKTDWRVGSFGRLRGAHSFHWRDKNYQHFLAVQLHHMQSNGFRENNEYNRKGTDLFYRHQLKGGQHIQVLGSFVDLRAQIPSSLSLEDFRRRPEKAADVWKAIAGFEDYQRGIGAFSYRAPLSDNWYINSTLFYANRTADESRPFNYLTENSHRYGNRTRLSFRDSLGQIPLNGNTGFEIFREDYKWNTFSPTQGAPNMRLTENEELRQHASFFTTWNLSFNQHWDLNTALHVNKTGYELRRLFSLSGDDPSGDYDFDWVFSPRLGAVYHGSFGKNIAFDAFTRLSHGFSAPTLEETLDPEGEINPDIQPETGWNMEWGFRSFHPAEKWTFKINYYRMWVTNLLVARRTSFDQFIGINAGKTRHEGVETSFSWSAKLRQTAKASYFFSGRISYHYTHYRFVTFQDGEDDFSGNQLTGSAPHSAWGVCRLQAAFGGNVLPFIQLDSRYMDERPVSDGNTLYAGDYLLFNTQIGLDWHIDPGEHWRLHVSTGIRNIGDVNYPAMIQVNAPAIGPNQPRYFYPGAPRNYTGRIALSYRF